MPAHHSSRFFRAGAPGPPRVLPAVAGSLVLGTGLLAACGDGPSGGPVPLAVRDSAGIEIVENEAPLPAGEEAWTIGQEPVLHIGAGAEGDPALQFSRILGVHRLSDGSIAVVDAWAPAVAFFDESGELLGRYAQVGEGPGELPGGRTTQLRGSFTCGADTAYVVSARTVAAYAPPGTWVRSFSLDQPGFIRACAGGRILAQRAHTEWRTEPGIYVDSVLLVSHDLAGAERGVLDTLPSQERAYTISGAHGESTGASPQVFGRSLSVHARDDVVATGFGDRFEVELRGPDGALRRIVRVTGLERPVTATDVESFRGYVMDPWRGNDRERDALEAWLAASVDRSLPAFAALHVDAARNLWARRYDHLDAVSFYDYSLRSSSMERPRLEGPRRWSVLQADGRYLGEVEMPLRFEVHEIGQDHVLGVWRDDLDIEYVRAYPILRGGR